MKYIILRPHHLLCIPGYQGFGYSKEFEVNMQRVIDSLKSGIKAKITLGNDDICRFCNSPKNNICSNEFVEKIDSSVMNILGLKIGEVIDFDEKMDMLKSKLNPISHQKICSECIWMKKGYCSDTFK